MRQLFLKLAIFYGHHSPFPQKKWKICIFILWLGRIHPWAHPAAWKAFAGNQPPVDMPLRRGFSIRCHWQDTSYLAYTLLGDHQTYETDLFEKFLRPGDTIVDGGANIGFYTVLFALRAGPAGRVFAYEPVASAAAKVRENLALNAGLPLADVTFREAGLAEASRTEKIYLRPGASGVGIDSQHSSIVAGLNTPVEESIEEKIQLVSLDDEDIEGPVDIVKCDIEGAEKAFLEGARTTLTRDHPLLVLEWNPSPETYTGGEMCDLLAELGYSEIFPMFRSKLVTGASRAYLERFRGDVVCATPEHVEDRLRGLV